MGEESTRSVSIGKIKTLSMRDFVPATRSSEDTDLIYIVDLENGGSAIMGADKRMESIYAILDETKISPEKLTLTTTRSAGQDGDIEEFVIGMLNNKICSDAELMQRPPAVIDTLLEQIRPAETYWTETEVTCKQTPLLKTKWHQFEPYNNSCPWRDNGYERCVAGCVPIAVAQIMYYHRQPNAINGVTIDWDLISQYEYGFANPSDSATVEIANFIYRLGCAMNVNYNNLPTENGTASSHASARSILASSGYANATIENYSLPAVINMVAYKQKPVYAGGYDFYSNDGHAWVIDGCKIYNVEYWVRFYITMFEYEDTLEETKYYNLVHCNYGWGGSCDGYYTSGLFNTTIERSTDYIDKSVGDLRGTEDYILNNNLTLITY